MIRNYNSYKSVLYWHIISKFKAFVREYNLELSSANTLNLILESSQNNQDMHMGTMSCLTLAELFWLNFSWILCYRPQ